MSFFDGVKGQLGGLLGGDIAAALPGLIQRFFPGGLQAVLDQLQQSGLGAQVNSWLGRGPNEPITPQDLQAALGDERVRELATKAGLPVDQLLALLAQFLPATVDDHSPDGQLKPPPPAA